MSNLKYYNEYYEKLRSNTDITEKEKKRIETLINLIPKEVNSIIEVGCGDGRLINCLKDKHDHLYGMDISEEIIKTVEVPKIIGSIDDIPFKDNEFDLVICSEVLEHLPINIYEKSLSELERISDKYILISVPNDENIKVRRVECPECNCAFHPWRHLRSYKLDEMKNLFNKFNIHKSITFIFEKDYPDFIIKSYKLYCKLINRQQKLPETCICPQCGHSSIKKTSYKKKNPLSDNIKKFLTKKKGGWIIVLYKKIE